MNLKKLRLKANLTQIELASLVGCHKQQIYNIESGVTNVPKKYIQGMAKALRIKEKDLADFVIQNKIKKFLNSK